MNIIEYALLKKMLGSGGATAYHLTSVDELPTDAVDGSLAVVSRAISDTGTWLLNEEITQANLAPGSSLLLQFECNDVAYSSVRWGQYGPGSSIFALSANYINENGNTESKAFYIHNPSGDYGIAHGWADEVYRTIVVSLAFNDGLTWLLSNGKKVVEGEKPPTTTLTVSTLYSRENGEWVSKGEI